MRFAALVLVAVLAACSAETNETDVAPKASTTVSANLLAAIDFGLVACAEYQAAIEGLRADFPGPKIENLTIGEMQKRLTTPRLRLNNALTRIGDIDPWFFESEKLDLFYERVGSEADLEASEIMGPNNFYLTRIWELNHLHCEIISQYR